jgi:hypothetical protein
MKLQDRPLGILAAVILSLSLPAATTAANGSNAGARMSPEYARAVNRADKDYEAANRRCEVLGMDQRKLCQRDSTLARRAAVIEAQPRSRVPSSTRPDAPKECPSC